MESSRPARPSSNDPCRGPWGAQGGPPGAPPHPPGRPRLPVRPRGASVLRQPRRTGAAGRAGGRAGRAAAGAWWGWPGQRRGRAAAGRRYLRSRAESPSQPRRLLNPTTQDGGCAATQRHVRVRPHPPSGRRGTRMERLLLPPTFRVTSFRSGAGLQRPLPDTRGRRSAPPAPALTAPGGDGGTWQGWGYPRLRPARTPGNQITASVPLALGTGEATP